MYSDSDALALSGQFDFDAALKTVQIDLDDLRPETVTNFQKAATKLQAKS